MDHYQLVDHPRPGRVVEGVRQLLVSRLKETEDRHVAVMMIQRAIVSDTQDFIQDTLAKPLQRRLAKLPEHLPVRFRDTVGHDFPAVQRHRGLLSTPRSTRVAIDLAALSARRTVA